MTPAFQRARFFYQADTLDGQGFTDTITANCIDTKGLSDSASIDVRLNAIPKAESQSVILNKEVII